MSSDRHWLAPKRSHSGRRDRRPGHIDLSYPIIERRFVIFSIQAVTSAIGSRSHLLVPFPTGTILTRTQRAKQ